jgi:hypothetical protein
MLNFYWDIDHVLKHNPCNLASKITVSIKFSNNAKKTKIVNRKMHLAVAKIQFREIGAKIRIHRKAQNHKQSQTISRILQVKYRPKMGWR